MAFELISQLWILLFITFLFSYEASAEKKSKRMNEDAISLPKYNLHHSQQLPRDKQISTFLKKGETKTFFYDSLIKQSPLSMTVLTCTSPLNWVVKMHHNSTDNLLSNLTTQDVQTLHMTSSQGQYTLEVSATEADTYVHIYVSTEPGGPQALQTTHPQKVLRLVRRQQRRKLTVRWEPSLVDPQVTDYCLVVGTRRSYATLCAAIGEKYGVTSPYNNQPETASQTVTAWTDEEAQNKEPPLITCVGSKTHFTLSNLRQNQGYHFNLFAINRQSNLTYLYGSTFTKFNSKTKPVVLKDNKLTNVNIKKFDGKVVLKYRVGRLWSESLKLYVIPCGGDVVVDVTSKQETLISKRKVEGFQQLILAKPQLGARYNIKIIISNREELRRSSGVEVLATTKPSSKTLFPELPPILTLKEYPSLRSCNSVTVGWLPSPEKNALRYCVSANEGKLGEFYKIPSQCGLDNRLRKSADYSVKYCRDLKGQEEVLVQQVDKLKPGKSYVVQITVKKPKGKTLSYELLQVQTLPSCSRPKPSL